MIEHGKQIPSTLPYSVQVWNYGDDLLTINLPGEVVVDYSLRFKREYDPARTWVDAYSNDVPCYIPSQRVWEEGGYEAAAAMIYYARPTCFASGIETIIASAVKDLVPRKFVNIAVEGRR
jgi:neutral ceramidase